MIQLDKIGHDSKFYPRFHGDCDWQTAYKYSETLALNPRYQFPPIVVVRSTGKKTPFLILDGVHRKNAYKRAGRKSIPAVVERLPESKWLARAYELNRLHGRPLESSDKASVAVRLKEQGWSIDKISDLMQMRVASLEKMMVNRVVRITSAMSQSLPDVTEVNGKSFGILKAALAGTTEVEEALETQSALSSGSVSAVLDSMISILRAKVIDMSNEDIVGKVKAIKKLMKAL